MESRVSSHQYYVFVLFNNLIFYLYNKNNLIKNPSEKCLVRYQNLCHRKFYMFEYLIFGN